MKKLSSFIKKLASPEVQDLARAQYINGDLEPTSQGRDKLMEILWMANQAELVAAARADIAEAEKEEAKSK